jgi:hypothetical protein|tara:strand:- start:1897 stop:2067 length:171 start_codon:yes stop_codon:yes gene_type:complete
MLWTETPLAGARKAGHGFLQLAGVWVGLQAGQIFQQGGHRVELVPLIVARFRLAKQ